MGKFIFIQASQILVFSSGRDVEKFPKLEAHQGSATNFRGVPDQIWEAQINRNWEYFSFVRTGP